jgi:6-pyruvoyltetrahydropterin/6-carboxytetrahydropterin synthase
MGPAGDAGRVNMFQVSVEETFSAGHALRGYKGKCENPHGHNYRVRVTIEGQQLDSVGLLYDFTNLKRMLREVIGALDHQFLNDLAPFDAINPSAENIAKFFHEQASRQIPHAPNAPRIAHITVWETDETSATYTP